MPESKVIVAPPGGGADNSVLQFVPTAEGFYSFTENRYIYLYKDHLGNTRVSFAKNSAGGLETLDTNAYYPFGMNFLRSEDDAFFGQSSYKNYKYNGKELQETGMYDYGARMYMPDIGRWGVIDPLAEASRRWSPYTYAYNNPIRFIDPDGRQADDWRNKNGQLVYDPKANGGKGAYTQYASATEKKYGDGLRNSGKTGAEQFNKLVNSTSKISLNIDSTTKAEVVTTPSGKQGKGFELGVTDQGRIATTTNKAGTEVVKVVPMDTQVITINTAQIKELQNDLKSGAQKPIDEQGQLIKNNDLTVDQIGYSTFGHEIEHTTNDNIMTGFNNPSQEETKPTQIGNQILKEIIDGKSKK